MIGANSVEHSAQLPGRQDSTFGQVIRSAFSKLMAYAVDASRLNTNIGDTRGKIAILLEARRRFDVNCLLPQCFRSLEEKALL